MVLSIEILFLSIMPKESLFFAKVKNFIIIYNNDKINH